MTLADREAHVPSVSEEVVGVVDVTTLTRRQYCVVLDPVGPDGKPQLGQKRVVKVGITVIVTNCIQVSHFWLVFFFPRIIIFDVFVSCVTFDLLSVSVFPAGGALLLPAAWRAP